MMYCNDPEFSDKLVCRSVYIFWTHYCMVKFGIVWAITHKFFQFPNFSGSIENGQMEKMMRI